MYIKFNFIQSILLILLVPIFTTNSIFQELVIRELVSASRIRM